MRYGYYTNNWTENLYVNTLQMCDKKNREWKPKTKKKNKKGSKTKTRTNSETNANEYQFSNSAVTSRYHIQKFRVECKMED